MSKFKPGDLALIVSANAENVGKVVELVRFSNEKIILLQDGGKVANPKMLACWEVEADSLFATSLMRPDGFTTNRGAIPERNLMPIRGDFQPEQEKAKEVGA